MLKIKLNFVNRKYSLNNNYDKLSHVQLILYTISIQFFSNPTQHEKALNVQISGTYLNNVWLLLFLLLFFSFIIYIIGTE